MTWQIRIHDPSGETRTYPLRGSAILGRGETATIPLRDPTLPNEVATLWESPQAFDPLAANSPYWLKVSETSLPARIGALAVREAHLPSGLSLILGETRITLQAPNQVADELGTPETPTNVQSWLTRSYEGRQLLWTAKKTAGTPLSIYLSGETGTGKEVIAHLIHAWSERSSGPFVPLHCGALPVSLAESELFGHVKGAFTGAVKHRPGALMQAHGGTLFLDEVGDLPLDIQVKLLRFLESGEIRPVGADYASRSDVRLICATHHSLEQLVEEGKFRRDLYFRLASVTLRIPPLRNRPDDIELLSTRFASELRRTISHRAILRLQAHDWPGNVRELRHAIERASGMASPFDPVMGEEAFEFLLSPDNVSRNPQLELGASALTLHEMERIMLLKALKLSRGNRAGAARILGIARSTLFEMLKRHQIPGPKS